MISLQDLDETVLKVLDKKELRELRDLYTNHMQSIENEAAGLADSCKYMKKFAKSFSVKNLRLIDQWCHRSDVQSTLSWLIVEQISKVGDSYQRRSESYTAQAQKMKTQLDASISMSENRPFRLRSSTKCIPKPTVFPESVPIDRPEFNPPYAPLRSKRVLFSSAHSLVDFSNGASVATLDVLNGLAASGFVCQAFCTSKLDFQHEVYFEQIVEDLHQGYQLRDSTCGGGRAAALYEM